ncbi:Transcriptional regulator, LysR family [Vibrio casei]|nr:Transcriptional regulator, LysR family [Vibrio casei]
MKGYGFSSKSILDMSDDLLAGRVVHVMPEFTLVSTEMWFVCPSRQSITPAMRLLRDHFRTKVEQRLKELRDHQILPS